MLTYIIIGLVSGILFGILDGVINANPLARRLNEVYRPIARSKLNIPAGVAIDLAYGFIMAGFFVILFDSLPGDAGVVKGISFAVLAWFFRVAMSGASNWMMFKVPCRAIVYTVLAGLGEMLLLGILYGLFLKPW